MSSQILPISLLSSSPTRSIKKVENQSLKTAENYILLNQYRLMKEIGQVNK